MNQTLHTLTADFAIPGILAFDLPHPGMPRLRITTPACTAELYLHGAHLTHWQPAGEAPVLYLSPASDFAPDKPIRGGIPVIFPWFGARTEAITGNTTGGPSHGFARLQAWTLAFAAQSGDDLHLTLTLAPSDLSRSLGFDHFRLAFQLILGRTLTLRLTVANEAATPLHFEEALHTYFAIADPTQVSITGLEDTTFLDKTDHFAPKQQTGAITFSGETDRIYRNTDATVTLDDPGLHRRIVVAKSNSQTTVIWNPWSALSAKMPDMHDDSWRHLACMETANAGDNALTLAPNSTHTLETRIHVEKGDRA